MTRENFERTLRAFHRQRPFRSFTVELVSGEKVEVDHPEAMVLRGGTAVFIATDGAPSLFAWEGVSRITGEAPRTSAEQN